MNGYEKGLLRRDTLVMQMSTEEYVEWITKGNLPRRLKGKHREIASRLEIMLKDDPFNETKFLEACGVKE